MFDDDVLESDWLIGWGFLGCDWLVDLGFLMRGFFSLAPPVPVRLFLLCKACLGSRCGKVPIVMFQIVMVSLRMLDERLFVQVTINDGFLRLRSSFCT